jgi:hypothetical protein
MIILLFKTGVIFKKGIYYKFEDNASSFSSLFFCLFSNLFFTKFTNKLGFNESTGGEPEYKFNRKRILSKKLFLIL